MTEEQVDPQASKTAGGWLDKIERLGNRLPDPVTLFAIGASIVFLFSWLAAAQGWRSILTDDGGATILDETATNLLSKEGFQWLSQNLVQIFGRSSLAMPSPVSETSTCTSSPASRATTVTLPSEGVCRIAF